MATTAAKARRNGAPARLALRARLEARREELEATALTRVTAISNPTQVDDPAYAEGLRVAVEAAIEFGLEATERSAENAPPVPVALLGQARTAARVGIPLDTVLRRYFAGYSLLGSLIIDEARKDGLMSGSELQDLIGAQAAVFDRLLAAVAEEHAREMQARLSSSRPRQVEQIERLLAGEMVDTDAISYEFGGWHVGLALVGCPEAERSLRDLIVRLDCRLLLLPREDGSLRAWLGARRRLDPAELMDALAPVGRNSSAAVAIGEPAEGVAGWRLTHHQAAAALPIARRGSDRIARYANVALVAAALRDELLAASLHDLYLVPLEAERDGGETLRQTLDAYFDAGRNVSSTAFAIGVNRNTVTSRLRSVERRLGRSLTACATDLETALRLRELGDLARQHLRQTDARLPPPRPTPTQQHDETYVQNSAY